jgi:hypothetical protein
MRARRVSRRFTSDRDREQTEQAQSLIYSLRAGKEYLDRRWSSAAWYINNGILPLD